MKLRGLFDVMVRGLAIYFCVAGVTSFVAVIAAAKMWLDQSAMMQSPGHWSDAAPTFAAPALMLMAGVILWRVAPSLARATVHADDVTVAGPEYHDLLRIAAFLVAVYAITVGLGGVMSAAVGAILRPSLDPAARLTLTQPTWNDLASSVTWVLAGAVVWFRFVRPVETLEEGSA